MHSFSGTLLGIENVVISGTLAGGFSGQVAEYVGCPAGMTTYERVERIQGELIRIQVRAEDNSQAEQVLDSVDYKPRK